MWNSTSITHLSGKENPRHTHFCSAGERFPHKSALVACSLLMRNNRLEAGSFLVHDIFGNISSSMA